MKKSIVFFTHAPQGTLGDPSAASKLIKNLKARYRDYEIYIVLIVSEQDKTKVQNIFNGMDITAITVPSLEVNSPVLDIKGNSRVLNEILKQANGIIFFPTFHFFTENSIQFLRNFHKPTFIITEYNFYKNYRDNQLKKLGDLKFQWLVLNTGLGSGQLGIFSTEEKESSNNRFSLLMINDEEDIPFRDLLLNDVAAQDYHDSHQLFLGYFNKLNYEHAYQNVGPAMFMEGCLANILPHTKTVDIVIPLLSEYSEGQGQAIKNHKNINDLMSYFKENPSLINGYKVEYWKKNTQGKMECLSVGGEGNKVLRIINGYPFTPHTMDKLMKASDPFVMVTGDQSLSEAISHEKIFLYQVMDWKSELWASLKNEIIMLLGENSELHQFLIMQEKASTTSVEEFKHFLINHNDALREQMKALHHHILTKKNLYDTLPKQLINCIENTTNYLHCLLANEEQLEYQQIKVLVQTYPKDIVTIFNILIQREKFKWGSNNFIQKFIEDHDSYSGDQFTAILTIFYDNKRLQKSPHEINKSLHFNGNQYVFGALLGLSVGGVIGFFLMGVFGILPAAIIGSLVISSIIFSINLITSKKQLFVNPEPINSQLEVPMSDKHDHSYADMPFFNHNEQTKRVDGEKTVHSNNSTHSKMTITVGGLSVMGVGNSRQSSVNKDILHDEVPGEESSNKIKN